MKLCPTCQLCYEDKETECVQESHETLVATRPGDRLIADKYRLDSLIARGGMGAVYAGTHVDLDRPVAIKLLQSDQSADPASFERFRREARVAAKIKHPNIADIYDYGSLDDGESYIVMELVEGQTLLERIRQIGQLPIAETIMLSRQIAEGMEAAHHSGIIHRDLKPSNIVLTTNFDGGVLVKIIDFGIAKISEQLSADDPTLTATGTLVGTPRYMSPEQCLGHELDSRTDIYSFGVILYEMLAGQPPFDATSAVAIALKHVQELPPPLEQFRANIPSELGNLVTDLLSTEPSGRPQSATELKHRLIEIEDLIGTHAEKEQPALFPVAHENDEYGTQVTENPEKLADASSDPYATEVMETEPLQAAEIKPRPLFEVEGKTIKRAVPLHTVMVPITANAVSADSVSANAVSANSVSESNPQTGAKDFDETLLARKSRPRRTSLTPVIGASLAVAIIIGALALWAVRRSAMSTQPNPMASASPADANSTKPVHASSGVAVGALEKADNEPKDQTAGAGEIENGSEVEREQARSEITDNLDGWIAATNEGSVDRQMAFYNPTVDVFYRTRNVSSSIVRAEKERVFGQADRIEVQVGEPQLEFSDDGQTATTRFRKRYVIEGPQDNRRGEVLQELRWVKTNDGWKIIGERDLRVIRNTGKESRRGTNALKSPHQLVLKGVKKLIQPFH